MRITSDENKQLRTALRKLKVGGSLKKYVDLKGRQAAYNCQAELGIWIRALCTPETCELDLGKRLFQIERIR